MDSQISLEGQLKRWNDVIRDRPSDPRAYIQRGMVNFKLARIAPSIQDFDRAEELDARITPYLWQRAYPIIMPRDMLKVPSSLKLT